jgi:hypothetical protein
MPPSDDVTCLSLEKIINGLHGDLIEKIHGKVFDLDDNIIARSPMTNMYKTNMNVNRLFELVCQRAKSFNVNQITISFDTNYITLCYITIFFRNDGEPSVFIERNGTILNLLDSSSDFSIFVQMAQNIAEHTYPYMGLGAEKVDYKISVNTRVQLKRSRDEFECKYSKDDKVRDDTTQDLKASVNTLTHMIAQNLENSYVFDMKKFRLCDRAPKSDDTIRGGGGLARLYKKYMAKKIKT